MGMIFVRIRMGYWETNEGGGMWMTFVRVGGRCGHWQLEDVS